MAGVERWAECVRDHRWALTAALGFLQLRVPAEVAVARLRSRRGLRAWFRRERLRPRRINANTADNRPGASPLGVTRYGVSAARSSRYGLQRPPAPSAVLREQATRRWVPKVTITWRSGRDMEGRALSASDHEQDSRETADGYALEMGKQWVDQNT
jgi:hypothetical protein